jgi:hypothetical protein
MKYKIKDILLDKIDYSLIVNSGIGNGNNNCKFINFTYSGNEIEFQTPKVLIEKIIKEGNKEYMLLKIIGTEACKSFYLKIVEIEKNHNIKLNKKWFDKTLPINNIKTIFEEDCFRVKVPFRYQKPLATCYSSNGNLFNYYRLKEGMEIICLLTCGNIWINYDNVASYNLSVKELLVTKELI